MSAPTCTHEWTQEKYEVVSSRVCTLCNENEVEAQLATLTRERDAALARVKEIERDTTKAWNDHLKVCSEASAIAEILSLENMVKHEHAERMRLDGLRADLVRERDELVPHRAEALSVRQLLDAMMVPTTVTKPDGSKVTLETWERVRLVVEQRGEATSELARMKARPVEVEHSRLDVMWQQLVRERDEAQANYRFMVERAADQKLDGYRELGARAAAAENERDSWKSAAEAQNRQWSQKCTEVTELRAEFERVQGERDEACEELETLKALIEGEPWAGAVTRRERDRAQEDLEDTREALTKAHEALRAAEKREMEAVQELDEAAALLREAHRELSCIEAITISPSDIDGLINLVNRINTHLRSLNE